MDYLARLSALGALLRRCDVFWCSSPFTDETPAWCAQQPALLADCLALAETERMALERDPAALQHWLQQHLPALAELPALIEVPAAPGRADLGPAHATNGIPGRKLAQIAAFAAQVPDGGDSLLDWCSGKAHLGRNIARLHGCALHAVEHNRALCDAGQQLADRAGIRAHFQCADVLQDAITVPAHAQVVALHACGDLHRQLIDGPVLEQARGVVLAPCCYHLWVDQPFLPLSQAARAQDLQLDRNCVQLAVLETVHAPARELRNQATLAAWRLGFDALQRDVRGLDAYWQTPSLPHRILAQGFEGVCKHLAAYKQLALPARVDWAQYEQRGHERLARAQRLQLVRHGFRRPIELWLVLDLVLRLQERGFTTRLSTFCERAISPRNLLIQATR